MFRKLRVVHKLMLAPLVAATALLLILIAVPRALSKGDQLFEEVEKGYFPTFSLSRDLREALAGIQRNLQDAASSRDAELLGDVDKGHDSFLAMLDGAKSNPRLAADKVAHLRSNFEEYFQLARATTQRLIAGEIGTQLRGNLELMRNRYNELRDLLDTMAAEARKGMADVFGRGREQQRESTAVLGFITALSVLCLAALTLLSIFLVRSLVRPLGVAAATFDRLAGGDLAAEIHVTSSDEVGQLQRSMAAMLAYLREMADVASLPQSGRLCAGAPSGRRSTTLLRCD